MNEPIKSLLLQTTHWNDFNKIFRENDLHPDDLDYELKKHYENLWRNSNTDSSFIFGRYEDPLPKKK